ncbi:M23 family metallopeptidase [Gemmiger formicilis]|uniref:M23 family metallopeptidase n=1 Tax=Gemmiger formicilis TaxID=745368 RepID=UPI001FAF0443|nr:M23 family metallopeptidase [Gemmiger formicilis]
MKEIKTKPAGGQPRTFDKAGVVPKTAMKEMWLHTKDKALSETMGTPFAGQQDVSNNAPANTAGDQMLSGAETTAKKGAEMAYDGGKKLTQFAGQKVKERLEATRVKNQASSGTQGNKAAARKGASKGLDGKKTIKGRQPAAKPKANAAKTIKQGGKGIKGAQRTAANTQKAAKAAQQITQRMQAAAKATVRGIRAAAHAVMAALKAAVAAMQSLAAAILAGGWVAVVIILLICLIALVMGSSYGIFFGVESTGSGTSVSQAVRNLNQEYADHLQQISESVSHDRQEMTSNDGSLSINWQEVLAVFSAKVSGASDGEQVASLTDAQVDILRDILWEMNDVDYSTHTESHEVEVTTTNDDGEEETTTETVSETVLTIEITHKTAADMAQEYHFNHRQNEYLDLMMQPDNQNLWAQLLGGLVAGGGQIITPDTDWVPIGALAWPLPQTFSISSPFGYREDPFTGEIEYHNGTDIAAPNGTQILAAAAGTVTIANGIDSWGGSYGYHIKIDHGNGLETLYAHCSAICVTPGQQVQQGEVIGFVGSTGNSTGNHLHFEVWVSGERTDAMSFFSGN